MLKPLFAFFICVSLAGTALAQKSDTTILYFKIDHGALTRVESLDEADYYRLVIPPDPGDKRLNVKEVYKNGNVKLIGKIYDSYYAPAPTSTVIQYDGQCIAYYESGKKSAMINYKNGRKDGMEYLFYPTGKIYCVLKHSLSSKFTEYKWECYDAQGNQICQEGNGKWIDYKNNYTEIASEGPIKDGCMDGEWHSVGTTFRDTVKLVYEFKVNRLLSSVGYDKQGIAHPFKSEIERAEYKSGNIDFVIDLRHNIKLPRDTDGKKMSIDTNHVFFIVEKDGRLTGFKMYGDVDPKLKDAVFAGLAKINGWTPHKIFGIPYRTELVFPLNSVVGYSGGHFTEHAEWGEIIIKDN
jgi:hypothetical protein